MAEAFTIRPDPPCMGTRSTSQELPWQRCAGSTRSLELRGPIQKPFRGLRCSSSEQRTHRKHRDAMPTRCPHAQAR
eukprot:326681-Alexandrium_andersonii.AAC.1